MLWYRVAKVGTRTILSHLRKAHFHLDMAEAFQVKVDELIDDHYFTFAFVRNPWERFVSCYADKVVGQKMWLNKIGSNPDKINFTAFVDYVVSSDLRVSNIHFRLQSSLIDLNRVNFLGRHENFERDLKEVFARLSMRDSSVNAMNVSGGGVDYRGYYSSALIDKVARAYKRDIQIFGYEFE